MWVATVDLRPVTCCVPRLERSSRQGVVLSDGLMKHDPQISDATHPTLWNTLNASSQPENRYQILVGWPLHVITDDQMRNAFRPETGMTGGEHIVTNWRAFELIAPYFLRDCVVPIQNPWTWLRTPPASAGSSCITLIQTWETEITQVLHFLLARFKEGALI